MKNHEKNLLFGVQFFFQGGNFQKYTPLIEFSLN